MNTALKLNTIEDVVREIKGQGDGALNAQLYKSPIDAISAYDFLHQRSINASPEVRVKLQAKMATIEAIILQQVDINASVAGLSITGHKLLVTDPQQRIAFEAKQEPEAANAEEIQQETAKVVQLVPKQGVVENTTTEEVIHDQPAVKTIAHIDPFITKPKPTGFVEVVAELTANYKANDAITSKMHTLLINEIHQNWSNPFGWTIPAHPDAILCTGNLLTAAKLNELDFNIIHPDTKAIHRFVNYIGYTKNEEGKWVDFNKNELIVPETAPIAVLTVKQAFEIALSELQSGSKDTTVFKQFKENIQKCSDFAYTNSSAINTEWKKVMAEHKGIIAEAEVVPTDAPDTIKPEDKEVIVETAQEAAENGDSTLTPEAVKEHIKNVIVAGEADKSMNVGNVISKWWKSTKAYKLMGRRSAHEVIAEVKAEIKGEAKQETAPVVTEVKEKQSRRIFKTIELDQETIELARSCKDDKDFAELITKIVFEEKAWNKAANIVISKGNAIKNLEDKTENELHEWFNNIVKTVADANKLKKELEKKAAEEVKTETVVTETTPAEPVAPVESGNVQDSVEQNSTTSATENSIASTEPTQPVTESKIVIDADLKVKFKDFFKEGDTNKIKRAINNFLLDTTYKTFSERQALSVELFKLNKKYKHSKVEEISKIIDSIISTNEKIKALVA